MINWFFLVMIIIGILLIMVYPKIIRVFIFGIITYFTIFVNWYYAIAYAPLLILMLIYKRRKEKYG